MLWDSIWDKSSPLVVEFGGKTLLVLILLVIGWIAAGWAGMVARRAVGRAGLDETLSRFLGKLARWSVLSLVLVGCLTVFGVESTSFAAVIGSAGLAVGLALQGTLGNFAAGIMLLMFRPFNVGDVVQIAGETGKVNAVELFTTTLDTFDNRRFIIPNGPIFGSTIENITFHPHRRAEVAVGVAYTADIDRTRDVLMQAATSVPGSLETPNPAVVLLELGDSTVNWSVRVWAPTTEYGSVKQATVRAVKMALDAAQIEIPFPQMDVHLDPTKGDA